MNKPMRLLRGLNTSIISVIAKLSIFEINLLIWRGMLIKLLFGWIRSNFFLITLQFEVRCVINLKYLCFRLENSVFIHFKRNNIIKSMCSSCNVSMTLCYLVGWLTVFQVCSWQTVVFVPFISCANFYTRCSAKYLESKTKILDLQ